MNTDGHRWEPEDLDPLTERILAAVFEVSNVLGSGFLEKLYCRALRQELRLAGLRAQSEVAFRVLYKGHPIGDYLADLVVEQQVVVELKCVDRLSNQHVAQCINYLRASSLRVALLVNFQRPKVEWKRIVL